MTTWRDMPCSSGNGSTFEEAEPLLHNMRSPDIGVSCQTLVSNRGKSKKLPQYVGALSATLGGFVMGTILGWTSSTLAKNADEITKLQTEYGFSVSNLDVSLIGGLPSAGAMIGAAFGGMLSNKLGRKRSLIFLVIPSSIGWGLVIFADTSTVVAIGRFVLGLAMGAISLIAPQYTNEIAETDIRGTLGTYFQLQITIGIFFDYVVGAMVKVIYFNVICAVFPIILAVLMCFMPESPYYFLLKKNDTAARKSLQWMRGSDYDISGEIANTTAAIEKMEEEKLSFSEAFTTKPAKLGLVIGLGIMFFQQLSGINAVISYSSSIFHDAGSDLDASTSSMIVGGVSVIATYISSLIIDRLGRKPLLFWSDAIMAVSSGLLGMYFFLKEHTSYDVGSIGWLPVLSVSLFIIVFSIGYGPIPWMFLGEIFAPAIKGPASSICCLFNWFCAFLVISVFNYVVDGIGQGYTFWGFTLISAIGSVFVLSMIPETKGKTLEEIQLNLGGKKNDNVEAGKR